MLTVLDIAKEQGILAVVKKQTAKVRDFLFSATKLKE